MIFAEDDGGGGGLVSNRGLLKAADASRGGELTPVCFCGPVTFVAEEVGPPCERLGACGSTGGGEGDGDGDEDAEPISMGAPSEPGIGSSSIGGSSSRGLLDSRRGTERSMVWITGRILFFGIEDGG